MAHCNFQFSLRQWLWFCRAHKIFVCSHQCAPDFRNHLPTYTVYSIKKNHYLMTFLGAIFSSFKNLTWDLHLYDLGQERLTLSIKQKPYLHPSSSHSPKSCTGEWHFSVYMPRLPPFPVSPKWTYFCEQEFLNVCFPESSLKSVFFKHFPEINHISSHGLCLCSSFVYLSVSGFDLLFCVHSNYSIPLVFVPARLVNVLYLGLPLLSDSRFIVGLLRGPFHPHPPCKMRGIKTWSPPAIFPLHISKLPARLAR